MTGAVQQAQHIYLTPFVLTPDYQERIYLASTIPGDTERVNHSHLRLTPPALITRTQVRANGNFVANKQ